MTLINFVLANRLPVAHTVKNLPYNVGDLPHPRFVKISLEKRMATYFQYFTCGEFHGQIFSGTAVPWSLKESETTK